MHTRVIVTGQHKDFPMVACQEDFGVPLTEHTFYAMTRHEQVREAINHAYRSFGVGAVTLSYRDTF